MLFVYFIVSLCIVLSVSENVFPQNGEAGSILASSIIMDGFDSLPVGHARPNLRLAAPASYFIVYTYANTDCTGTRIGGSAIGLNQCYRAGSAGGVNSAGTPYIKGTSSGSTVTITYYSDSTCTNAVGTQIIYSSTCNPNSQTLSSVSPSLPIWPSNGVIFKLVHFS